MGGGGEQRSKRLARHRGALRACSSGRPPAPQPPRTLDGHFGGGGGVEDEGAGRALEVNGGAFRPRGCHQAQVLVGPDGDVDVARPAVGPCGQERGERWVGRAAASGGCLGRAAEALEIRPIFSVRAPGGTLTVAPGAASSMAAWMVGRCSRRRQGPEPQGRDDTNTLPASGGWWRLAELIGWPEP